MNNCVLIPLCICRHSAQLVHHLHVGICEAQEKLGYMCIISNSIKNSQCIIHIHAYNNPLWCVCAVSGPDFGTRQYHRIVLWFCIIYVVMIILLTFSNVDFFSRRGWFSMMTSKNLWRHLWYWRWVLCICKKSCSSCPFSLGFMGHVQLVHDFLEHSMTYT